MPAQPELVEPDNARPQWWRRLGTNRAQKREQDVDVACLRGDLRWLWREACVGCGLARLVFTPTGATMSIPTIGRIRMGPPTTFTVRLRPGQLDRDLISAAPRLAEALGVAGIRVAPLASGWVTVELRTVRHLRDSSRALPFDGRVDDEAA